MFGHKRIEITNDIICEIRLNQIPNKPIFCFICKTNMCEECKNMKHGETYISKELIPNVNPCTADFLLIKTLINN